MRTIPRYSAEYKADAVDLLRRTDRSISQVAESLGCSKYSLRTWYKEAEMAKKKRKKQATRVSPSSIEPVSARDELEHLRRENAALRKENDELKEDREILKKAAAFFAKESE
jgi:transposase